MFARRAIAGWALAAVLLTATALIWTGDLIALSDIAPKAVFWAVALALLGAGIGWEIKHRAERAEASNDEASAEADMLVRMLDDALAKAERKPPLLVEPIDLTALIAHASKRHGRTDLAGNPDAVHTLGEPAAITQLFQILIANALASGSRAIVRIDHGTTLVAVHVDDDGPGVPRAERSQVFEQRTYRRLPASERAAEREACVTARHIARGHGGDILISCSPEGGARFTVHLPLHLEMETARLTVMAS
ncbi:ATP-binding protein [Hyphomicrobium sp.]|uniref:ATP-binding protein n=1 Tax=Hyphomicrobium sp. TaxID=82 RepID=UPI003F6FF29D